MASDDALAEGQSQGRKRWFGGRGSPSETPTQEREGNMAPTEPGIEEPVKTDESAKTADEPVVEETDEIQVEEVTVEAEPVAAPLPAPLPETLASLRARGGEQSDEEVVLPLIISIANQKGGVGKTTTAVNLGAALAELDYRVLVIDLDPQGNATTGMGISHRNVEGSIYDVIMNDAPIEDCTEPTSVKNLFVVPATIDLAGAEIELVPAFSRELKLRRALAQIAGSYDFTLIDCPPSLGLLTVNGLAASDDVIVPIQCEYYALEGLGQLLRNVALVKSNLNPALDVRGIVLTMYDAAHEVGRAGGARGPGALRLQGLSNRCPADGAHLRSAVVRTAGDRIRFHIAGCAGVSRVGQGGESWRDPEVWVGGSVL